VLAAIQLDTGRFEASVDSCLGALSIYRHGGHRLGEARALAALGNAMERKSSHDRAMRHWREAEAIYATIGAVPEPALAEHGIRRQVSARLG
jgi:hypothetical protein